MKKRMAFVTGGSGFIGQHLIGELIDSNWQVTALARTKQAGRKIASLGATAIFGDLTKPKSYQIPKNTTHIFHLAAIISHDEKLEQEIFKVNLGGTNDLLNKALKSNKIKQFIHISTIGIYGVVSAGVGNEKTTPNPQSPYELSKLQAELLFKDKEYQKIPFTIIRPPVVIGYLDKASPLVTLYRLVNKGLFIQIGNRPIAFQSVYVNDLVDGIMTTIDQSKAIRQDFIMVGPIDDFNNIGRRMARLLNKKVFPGYLPVFFVRLISQFSSWAKILGLPVPIHPHSLTYLLTNRIFSSNKAKRVLDFRSQTNVDAVLPQIVTWYKESVG